jgi:hypothetical protein
VDGTPTRLCDIHRGHLTRTGAWVVADWDAPLDGPAPRFEPRPSTVNPSTDAWALAPEPKPVPPRPKDYGKTRTPTRTRNPDHDPALCVNETCDPGHPPRKAVKRGMCGKCAQRARNAGVYDQVANPQKAFRPAATAKQPTPTRNENAAPGMCVNATCPTGPLTPAICRGMCDLCGRLSKSRGVYDVVALPPNPGTRVTPRKLATAENEAIRAVAAKALGADAVEGLTTLGAVEAMAAKVVEIQHLLAGVLGGPPWDIRKQPPEWHRAGGAA